MNQEIRMYYSVSVDHNGMVAHFTRNDCEGSYAVVGTDDMLGNDSEEDGNVRSVRKMKAVTVKIDTVTLIGRSI
jgi:hypothetical protein